MEKSIEIKETSLFKEEGVKLNYAHILSAIVNKPLKQGITLKQMKSDLKIINMLDEAKAGDVLTFDEDQINKIKTDTESHLWGMHHNDFNEFGDYIETL